MKQIVIVCEMLQELTRLRKYFNPAEFTVKAVTSFQTAQTVLRSQTPDLIIFDIGEKFDSLFPFYKFLRSSFSCMDIPVIVMAMPVTQKALADNVELINTKVVGSTINVENMEQTIAEMLNKDKDGNSL